MSAVMDRPIWQPWWRRRRLLQAGMVLVVLLLLTTTAVALLGSVQRNVRIPAAHITFGTVERGIYQDFIPLRSKVVPRDTIYLDALEGGRVERVLVEPGDLVVAGQPLVELSNTELELDVLDREARLIESITQLQTYQTQLEQNRLNNEKALELIDYDIVRLRRSIQRRNELSAKGLEAREAKDAVQDELDYIQKLRPLQARSNEQQNQLRLQQLPQIDAQLKKLQQDVEITRSKLNNLTVRAPIAGRMTAIDLKVGETRNRGQRFGEITPETGYKLSANIDEFYLDQLRKNQAATVQIGDRRSVLRVMRVYPQVKDGVFAVELAFDGATPDGLLPGQTVQGKLALGNDTDGIVLQSGAFLERTGGDWVFVLASDGASAQRRRIRIGRRNAEQVEILSGLQPGEQVITSDYAGLEHIDHVDLTR